MQRLLLSILAFCFSSPLFSQINIQWEARYTTAGSNIDRARSMALDSSGNSYVTGTSWNGGNFDITTVKFDANGILLWSATYNGPGNGLDEARKVVYDTLGNVYVTGYSAGLSANYDMVTIKYNAAGAQQWVSRYNGPASGFDEAYDMAVDLAGNVYITGGSAGSGTGNDYATLKYNTGGVQQWVTRYTFSGANQDVAYAIELDAAGNVYVTGNSYTNTANNQDAATLKYNNNGVQQWVNRYNGPGSVYDTGNDLIVNTAGEVFIAGYQRALVGITNYDFLTQKISATGTQLWASSYNGPGNDQDRANVIKFVPGGKVVVAGRSLGTPSTAEDCITILYDEATGAELWSRRYDGGFIQYDEARDVVIDNAGMIYVTGWSFVAGENNNFLTIKYDQAGTEIWVTKFNGQGNNADQAYAMAFDSIDNIYVGGLSKGLGTNEDYAVIKYCQLITDGTGDTAICLGNNVQLDAFSSFGGIDSVWWTPTAGLNNPNIANPIATPAITTTYVAHIRNTYGCIDTDSVLVTVYPLPGPQIVSSGDTAFCIGSSVTLTANDTTGGIIAYQWSNGDTTQSTTVTTAGTYSVTITNGNTCQSQSQQTIIVYNLPTVATLNDTGLCASGQLVLCATGGVSYAWSPAFGLSDTTIACPTAGPTQSTTYIVVGTDANGCINSDTVNVFLLPSPPVPVISQNVAVLTSSAAAGYQWYFNNQPIVGETNQTFTPTQNGTYYVVIFDSNGCSSFSSTFVMNDVGIFEINATLELNVFPNPNNGQFYITFNQNLQPATLLVYDGIGQLVHSENLAKAEQTTKVLDLGNVPAGIYFVQVQLPDGQIRTRTFVVED
jgi:uncharacterized delta-60 repeat protein